MSFVILLKKIYPLLHIEIISFTEIHEFLLTLSVY